MAKRKRQNQQEAQPVQEPVDAAPYWSFFFQCQRNPVLRSQLITSLMAGQPLEVERLPAAMLLDVTLLATATREYHEAEIIDDYHSLIRTTEEHWRDPMWTVRVFDQTHLCKADYVLRGATEFVTLEDSYIPALAGWYLGHDVPTYFSKELEPAESKPSRKAAK